MSPVINTVLQYCMLCDSCTVFWTVMGLGQRFKYTYYNKVHGEIWQSVEQLDRMVSTLISSYFSTQSEMDHCTFTILH